ncbi:MAG: hypothetical protein JOS17DRAFT_663548, partial [Linnemannia elongata]
LDGRVITASIMSSSLAFEATICVMYADANPTDRKQFFLDCLSLPFFLSPPQHSFLLGDLNYQHHHSRPHPEFQDWVNSHLVDCITPPHTTPSTTFTHTGNKTRTTIDYIFSSFSLLSQVSKPEQLCSSPFSDHDMLILTLTPSTVPQTGRGLWRMNTRLLDSADFRKELDGFLSTLAEPF